MDTKHDVINLKVADSLKTEDWYKAIADYYIPSYSNTIAQFDELKKAYEFVNNDLSGFTEEISIFCNPLGEDLIGEIIEELKPFNKIPNKIAAAGGELLNRPKKNKVILLNAKSLANKDKLYLEEIRKSIEERIALELESLQFQDPKQQEEFVKQQRSLLEPQDISIKNFLTDSEIFYNKILKYCRYAEDLDTKELEVLNDAMIADRAFTYSGWKHGKPSIEICNTLYTGFHKSPNERWIQKGDYVWYKKSITMSDAIQKYGNQLTDEQLEDLMTYSYSYGSRVDKRHDIFDTPDLVHSYPATETYISLLDGKSGDAADKRVGKHQGQGLVRDSTYETLIWETHMEFKGFKEITFISYRNEYNKKVYDILSKDFEIPKEATKENYTNKFGEVTTKYVWNQEEVIFEAEKMYIPWRHELTRLGDSIIVDAREVPLQPVHLSNPFSNFELSYKGCIFNSRNAKSISPVQRAIPAQLQYYFVKHIQLRELAKYQGYMQDVDVDQIPESLGQDKDGNIVRDPIATWLKMRKTLSTNFYSGSQNSLGGLPPSTRSPGSRGYMLGTAIELMNLQNLLDLIDREISLLMGFSPQREAQYANNSNVSDNQQAISQSYNITEPMFHMLEQIWKYTLNDYLYNMRAYAEMRLAEDEETIFHYFLPDGTEELLKVTPAMLHHEDIGLFVTSSGASQRYIDMMANMSHSIAQNAGEGIEAVSTLIKAITSGASPEEVHKMIQLESQRQASRAAEMQQKQLDSQEKMSQVQLEIVEKTHQQELEKITLKESLQKERELAKETIKSMGQFDENPDADSDGQLDVIEVMNAELKREKLDLDKAKFQHQIKKDEKDLEIKEKNVLQKKNSSK